MDLSNATVAQLAIPVTDLDRAIPFYRDTLGIPFLFTAPPKMSFFQAGAVRLLVGVPEGPMERSATIYFKVSDIKAVYETLKSRGASMGAEPHVVHRTPAMELWLCEFRDPDGNVLALMSEVAQ